MSKLWWLKAQAFQSLSSRDRHRMLQLMHAARYDAQKVVYSSSLPGDVIYLVQQGQVTLYHQTPVKTRRKLVGLEAGDLFGCLGLVDEGYKPALAMTETHTQMLVLRKGPFEQLMKYFPETGARIVEHLQQEQHKTMNVRYQLNAKHTGQRLHRLLLHYLDNPAYVIDGQSLPFALDTKQLANQLGCRQEVVTICLSELEAQGLIACESEQIQLLNRQGLRKKVNKRRKNI